MANSFSNITQELDDTAKNLNSREKLTSLFQLFSRMRFLTHQFLSLIRAKFMIKRLSYSTKTYAVLILMLTFFSAVNICLAQNYLLPDIPETAPPKAIIALINGLTTLIIYGGLGYIGLKLSSQLNIPELLDNRISHQQRFLIPAYAGTILGIFFIVADYIFTSFHHLGKLPHPPFPASILISINAAIGEEIIFRLFFISLGVWLISSFSRIKITQIFWFVTTISAIAFALAHLPALMLMFGLETISQIPLALLLEVILLNGVISFVAAYYFQKFGFLAAVSLHFWTDIIWHVIYGLIA